MSRERIEHPSRRTHKTHKDEWTEMHHHSTILLRSWMRCDWWRSATVRQFELESNARAHAHTQHLNLDTSIHSSRKYYINLSECKRPRSTKRLTIFLCTFQSHFFCFSHFYCCVLFNCFVFFVHLFFLHIANCRHRQHTIHYCAKWNFIFLIGIRIHWLVWRQWMQYKSNATLGKCLLLLLERPKIAHTHSKCSSVSLTGKY